MKALERASRKQLQRAERLGESLDARIEFENARRAHIVDKDPEAARMPWVPDEEWRKDFNNVNTTIAQAGQSLIRALEGNKKNLAGVPTEQLEAQFKAELARAAANMTPEEWAVLDKIRMQQALAPTPAKDPKKK